MSRLYCFWVYLAKWISKAAPKRKWSHTPLRSNRTALNTEATQPSCSKRLIPTHATGMCGRSGCDICQGWRSWFGWLGHYLSPPSPLRVCLSRSSTPNKGSLVFSQVCWSSCAPLLEALNKCLRSKVCNRSLDLPSLHWQLHLFTSNVKPLHYLPFILAGWRWAGGGSLCSSGTL